MSVVRSFRCDLCRDPLTVDGYGANQAIGLYWFGKKIEQRLPREVEHHICPACLSSLQQLPDVCGQGFDCAGGPNCGSDHK